MAHSLLSCLWSYIMGFYLLYVAFYSLFTTKEVCFLF